MILQTDKDFLPISTNGNKLRLKVIIEVAARRIIEKSYKDAAFDFEALAAIRLAEELGFKDLAQNLEAKYHLDLEVPKEDKEAA